MIIVKGNTDSIQVITGSDGEVDIHASWVDNTAGVMTYDRQNTIILTASTVNVVPSPNLGTVRNLKLLTVRNNQISTTILVTIQHTDGTNIIPIFNGVLQTGQSVVIDESGKPILFSAAGIALQQYGTGSLRNTSVATQGPGFPSDTYLLGSNILLPAQGAKASTIYRCSFDASKTGAGTGNAVVNVRVGTNGSTADTARLTFNFGAQTANADIGQFEIWAVFKSVGAGSAAVLQGRATLTHGTAGGLGFTTLVCPTLQVTSAGFDSTIAGTIIGLSVNGNASAQWTVQSVETELTNL